MPRSVTVGIGIGRNPHAPIDPHRVLTVAILQGGHTQVTSDGTLGRFAAVQTGAFEGRILPGTQLQPGRIEGGVGVGGGMGAVFAQSSPQACAADPSGTHGDAGVGGVGALLMPLPRQQDTQGKEQRQEAVNVNCIYFHVILKI